MNYYYLKNGETLGPLPIGDLIKIIDESTLVWNEDGSMKDWLPAKDIEPVSLLFREQVKLKETMAGIQFDSQINMNTERVSSKPTLVIQNSIDKKRIYNDYITNKLSDGFVVLKRDDENYLIEIKKNNGSIVPKDNFNHSRYFKITLLIMLPGLIGLLYYYNFLQHSFFDSWRISNGYDTYGADKEGSYHEPPWYYWGQTNWILFLGIPFIIGLCIWRINFNKHSKQVIKYKDLVLRTVINDSGQVIEKTI